VAGELAGNLEMPPQTPIHIALDILDPGMSSELQQAFTRGIGRQRSTTCVFAPYHLSRAFSLERTVGLPAVPTDERSSNAWR
jgi:hypothetical protein